MPKGIVFHPGVPKVVNLLLSTSKGACEKPFLTWTTEKTCALDTSGADHQSLAADNGSSLKPYSEAFDQVKRVIYHLISLAQP